jgi:tRNA-modifying protein YgfZ
MTERSTLDSAFRAATQSAVVCRLSGLAALRIEGDDAQAFLQGQLSSDVAALVPSTSQWSTYNSPKGRMLASLRLWRNHDGSFGALIADDLAATVARRLAMFVLRAKVRIADQSPSHAVIGVGGPAAGSVVAGAGRRATLVALDERRFVLVAENETARVVSDDLARVAAVADEMVWRWLAIVAGVPLVTASTSDQFVPQMLNWDALGGINFQKGCYPGQEIVARMRYLGRLKERLYGFRVGANREPEAGERIFGAAFGATACGTVINASPAPDGGYVLLAVVQTSAIEAGGLALAAADGLPLTPFALPYALPDGDSATRVRP